MLCGAISCGRLNPGEDPCGTERQNNVPDVKKMKET
jgi:hypothetical protein